MTEKQLSVHVPLPLRVFEWCLAVISLICKITAGVSLVSLTVLFGYLVFGRYVLNATPTWVEQTSLLLVMVIAFLGAAVGIHEQTHLSVNFLVNAVGHKAREFLIGLSHVVLGIFGGMMFWYGLKLTRFKWGSDIPLLGLPEGLRSLPLTIAGVLIALFSLAHLLRQLLVRGRTTRAYDTPSTDAGNL